MVPAARVVVPDAGLAVVVWKHSVPALTVVPQVYVFTPLKINGELALFCVTAVTFGPMMALTVVGTAPTPVLLNVPAWFMVVVENVTEEVGSVPSLLIVRFPVPATPPVKVME